MKWTVPAILILVSLIPVAYVGGVWSGKREGAAEVRAEMNRALADALAEQGEVLTRALEAERTATQRERARYQRLKAELANEPSCSDPVPACLRRYLDGLR